MSASETKFQQVISHLEKRGIGGPENYDLVRIYAEAFAQFIITTEKIAQHGHLVKSPREGLVVSPLVIARDGAVSTMDRIGRQLGLSPDHVIAARMPAWSDYASTLIDDDQAA